MLKLPAVASARLIAKCIPPLVFVFDSFTVLPANVSWSCGTSACARVEAGNCGSDKESLRRTDDVSVVLHII
jgi:hypothetical protein